jgi:hypothetical protein
MRGAQTTTRRPVVALYLIASVLSPAPKMAGTTLHLADARPTLGAPPSPPSQAGGPRRNWGAGPGAAGRVCTWRALGAGAASRPGLHSPAGGHGGGGGEVGGVGAGRAGRRGPRRRAAGVADARGGGGRRGAVEVGQVERAGHEAAVAGRVQQPLSAAAVVQQLVHNHAPGLGDPRHLGHRLAARRSPHRGPSGKRARARPGAPRVFNRPPRTTASPAPRPGHWRRRSRLPAPPPDAPGFQ